MAAHHFGTKNRQQLIGEKLEPALFNYIRTQLKKQACEIKAMNGMPDHIHILISINPKLSVAEVIKQIKGSSSHWINQQNLTNDKFSWQTGYGVFSVSESQLSKVNSYIEGQKEHHRKSSFQDEYSQFLKVHNIDVNG